MRNTLALSTLCSLAVNLVSGAVVASNADITTTMPKSLWSSWAMYSPYYAVGEYESAPKGCRVTQANILQRHGARYPTSGASKLIVVAVDKLLAVQNYTNPDLDFLRTWTYELSTDNLVPFGAAQSLSAGEQHYERYSYLVSRDQIPFVRADSAERTVDSARNWTAGFSLASHGVYDPSLNVILSSSGNDTLDDSMCTEAGSSDDEVNAWVATYATPIAARLNEQAPGANLTASDVYSLMSLCPFESVYFDKASPFCNLFTQAEFNDFEYYGDLDKYYGNGYGQALGPVQGVGYVNELIARLTDQPVSDETQTNHTLDASSETFPLNRTIYADFSHDNQMISIYAAMGLFSQSIALDPTSPNPKRTWLANHLVPFSARMITEKLSCTEGWNEGEYVRIFVDDALQSLEFCGAVNGLCTVDAFVESQSYARNNGDGDWEQCFV